MKNIRSICLLILLGLIFTSTRAANNDSLSVMFYNVENLFDTEDDSTKNDNEFLPESAKEWTNRRWSKKTHKIAQVISAAKYPAIIGLCEVENKAVLEKLVKSRLMRRKKYQILHFESPDFRGIDVAILYRPSEVNLLAVKATPVRLGGRSKTRDILAATFSKNTDTLSVFVNHWPSRYGGIKKSKPKRLIAAKVLKRLMDSVKNVSANYKLVAIGDFNDEPKNKSLKVLKGYKNHNDTIKGTLKYKGKWKKFDQCITSKNAPGKLQVLRKDFLFEKDSKYGGIKPHRTYRGPKYLGGFSDHLPIIYSLKL